MENVRPIIPIVLHIAISDLKNKNFPPLSNLFLIKSFVNKIETNAITHRAINKYLNHGCASQLLCCQLKKPI